jgi:hypothetical protein
MSKAHDMGQMLDGRIAASYCVWTQCRGDALEMHRDDTLGEEGPDSGRRNG